ncbi:MAG TPA: hypothetical protein VLG50_06400, partial [Candidatus Saccharimonadales bacterium]|nr:hypothetical protein [Candidatus Saccharimonadales bacterium]
MTTSRHKETIEESKSTDQTLSCSLSTKDYRCLPEKFSLEDIKPILTKAKLASLHKIYDLWRDDIDLEIYGSFVVQCGRILVGKHPTNATDIDAASSITPLEDCAKLLKKLSTHGFTEKKLATKPNPFFSPAFYSYEFNDGTVNVDFTVRLPSYDNNTPNVLLLSDITMKFVDREASNIHLKFDNRQFILENYCNQSMYPLVTPHIDERGVIRRILKQIKNNKHLYDHDELHMCYKRQTIQQFTKDDPAWKRITDLLKHDFKKHVGTKKFMSYFNEMSRMIKEHTFCMPEATVFIENFCETILENHYKKQKYTNNNIQTEASNMTAILQQYFKNHEQYADKFFNIINYLLYHSNKLQYNDEKMHAELLLALDKAQPDFNDRNNRNRLFAQPSRDPRNKCGA